MWSLIHSVVSASYGALRDAQREGGHGWTSPATVRVYVGSTYGRHRSVAAVEAAAVGVRRKLRDNEGGEIQCPCSVGTEHRDLDRRHEAKAYGRRGRREDDDDD